MFRLLLVVCLTAVVFGPDTLASTAPSVVGGVAASPQLDRVEGMTAAQLQRLTADQIEALLLEADSAVGKVGESWSGRQATPKWPNPDETMFYAVVNSFEAFERDEYKKVAGPDWTSNGCSFPVASAYKKTFDVHACLHHDYGYRNLAQYRQARNDIIRKALDLRLLLDMSLQCLNDSSSKTSQQVCNVAALGAYVQARKTGKGAFYATPARYP